MVTLSVLDLSPICEGGSAADSFRNTLDLARHADGWGFNRYWLAEHHGMPGIASAATAVLIGQVAAATSRIRVGAGGIMLPNHSPLVIAEQFGTLESLFPGRIDLGLGRAPGSDQQTSRALRRYTHESADAFPQDVVELMDYFYAPSRQPVQAVPGAGLNMSFWILGSSLFGAQLAAALGLPYAFASHFAPQFLMQAIQVYRQHFQPSAYLDKPHVMAGFNVFAADTDEQAEYLASSWQQSFVSLRSGRPIRLPPPSKGYLQSLPPPARQMIDGILSCSAVGSPETVQRQIQAFVDRTGVDELMINSNTYDHQARLRAYEITSQVGAKLTPAAGKTL